VSRIVFAWELGANYGYISQFLPFARELKARGHEVVMVVRELHHASRMLADNNIPLMQAPLWLPTIQGLPEPPLNYAEILLRYGYHDASSLSGVVNAWRALFTLYRADVLIASHAPTALLAARTMGLTAAPLGTGFSIPPHLNPTPNLRYWIKVPYERLVESDQIVLKTSNTILRANGVEPLKGFSDLFAAQETFLCTLPELDHYPHRADATYWGAVYDTEMGEELAWPEGGEENDRIRRILVYLEPQHRDFDALLETIVALGHVALICAPGISDNQVKKYSHGKVRVLNQPIKFSGLLEKCDLMVCHGGHGTTAAMLRAGIPLLLFPNHLEQFLLALRIKEMGMGDMVNAESPPPNMAGLLSRTVITRDFRDNARAFAAKYQAYTREAQLAQITARIESLAVGK
jgi:UDP:flavonoid glycosyltransferase YjiC (YdhE family)